MSTLPVTEQRNPHSYKIDTKSTEEILRIINSEDKTVPLAVEKAIPELTRLVDRLVDCFKTGGRLFYCGAGTSGRLGVLDASECPPTYGVPPSMVQGLIAGGLPALTTSVEGAEDDPLACVFQMKEAGFCAKDMLVGITASGQAPYVLGALDYARSLGCPTGAISSNADSKTFEHADYAIYIPVGPEIVTGSSRMKSGTGQKLVLNMITTTAMIRLGKVYNNFMIDLRPLNSKLVLRSKRLIAEILSCSLEEAETCFEGSGRVIRTAVVMGALGISRSEAENLLAKNGGNINFALDTAHE